MFIRLAVFGLLLLIGMVIWSWLRSLNTSFARRNRGVVGWVISAFVMIFIFAVLKALLPKI